MAVKQDASGDRPWRPLPAQVWPRRSGRAGWSEVTQKGGRWPWPHLNPGRPVCRSFALWHAELENLSNTLILCKDLTTAGPDRDRDARPAPGVGALGLEAGAGHQGPVVQAERTAEGGAEEAAGAGNL